MVKILIADDEPRMRKLVSDFLKNEGYLILEAADGKEALTLFEQDEDISLMILDIMMPGCDGWSVCREVRQQSDLPIIMLTARGEETDELFGFELGADEYISKPFSPRVLVARVNALLRRVKKDTDDKRKIKDLEIDKNAHLVKIGGSIIDLTLKEYELLAFLADNPGRALSRDQILNAVWDINFYGDIRTVDTHIKKLRLKLGDYAELIQTVRGFGYRFEDI